MQSLLNESEPETWTQIAPLLETAMESLNEKDRNAVVLRFFENRKLNAVGAAMGISEEAAKKRVSRAVEKGRTQGFMKIIVHAETQRILGAAVLGVGGDEVIHQILDVMYAKAPYTVLMRAMHIHPTVSELVPTMLGELAPLS